MTDQEMLDAMKALMKPVYIKLEDMDNRMCNMDNRISNMDNKISNMENKISNMENELSNLKYEVRKGFRKIDDEIETLVEVLYAKNILPRKKQQV